jgi:hypothetical protein
MITMDKIANYFDRKGINYQIHKPGHDNEKDVIVANWNNVPDKLTRWIEENFEIDWEDESGECIGCYQHIHTTPGYYGDLARFTFINGEGYICKDCFLEDDDNLEGFITHSDDKQTTRTCYPWMKDMINRAGFVLFNTIDEYESGFHHGQTDDPSEIKKWIYEAHGSVPVLFMITDAGQFDIHFNAYYKKEE